MTTAAPPEQNKYRAFFASVRQIRYEGWGEVVGYAFIAPMMLHWLIFGAFPYVRGLLIVFQDYRFWDPKTWSLKDSWVGLDNLLQIFKDPYVAVGIRASFYMWISTWPLTFIMSLWAAVVLNRVKNPKLAALYRVIITLAWVIPEAGAGPIWRFIYDPNVGYLNYLLKDVLKIWPDPPAWMSDRFWYFPAMALMSIWKGYGYNMLLLLLGLYNIPSELYDAAKIDGANNWQQLIHVELPGIRNLLVLFLVTGVGWVGGGVLNVMTFGAGPPARGLPQPVGATLNYYAWNISFYGAGRLGFGAAMQFFAGLCNLVLVGIAWKLVPSQKA